MNETVTMLSLPSGIKRSISDHNSDHEVFYDWLEADVLFLDDELSESDVIDFLIEEQIYVSQDFCSEFVSNAWAQIEKRLGWMGTTSPILFEKRRMKRRVDWQDVPCQSFCLVVSLGLKYTGWREEFGSDYTEQGSLFESITHEAMAHVFQGWHFIKTGWARDHTSNLQDVVGNLVEQLGERVGDLETYASDRAHEAGLDLVWYLPFSDQRGGLPVFLAQCASGWNWDEKLDTPNLGQWMKIIDFASKPYKAFSLPFALDNKNLRLRSCQIKGLLLDRYRLLVHPTSELEWVSSELRQELIGWLEPRIQWLLDY